MIRSRSHPPARSILRTAALSLGLLAADSAIPAARVAAPTGVIVAHVLEAKGEWHVDGQSTPVVAGEGVATGAKILATSNHVGDVLTLVRDADLTRSRTLCDDSPVNPCRLPLVIGDDRSTANAGVAEPGVMKAFLGVLLDRPPAVLGHYAVTLTRGERSLFMSEAVVAVDPASGLVLPPAPSESGGSRTGTRKLQVSTRNATD